ncbi:hypothetical protein SISSUDRAFT_490019 [Sistotremastrum suecicum HHB10207 ss-3]|uniref:Uncharacterized protein n=1 Tax=Sistotremastrum suecicum HHB10207 ss-3 TaxID=1314776 RepID=A0A165XZQ9_9AGAM|nr:hypothetical protein SISSUDRAFT_490019 [Sistotremastrum suecicum HHB10207 ss-3]
MKIVLHSDQSSQDNEHVDRPSFITPWTICADHPPFDTTLAKLDWTWRLFWFSFPNVNVDVDVDVKVNICVMSFKRSRTDIVSSLRFIYPLHQVMLVDLATRHRNCLRRIFHRLRLSDPALRLPLALSLAVMLNNMRYAYARILSRVLVVDFKIQITPMNEPPNGRTGDLMHL